MNQRNIVLLGLLLLLMSCTSTSLYVGEDVENRKEQSAPVSEKPLYSLFLLGDGGSPSADPTEPTLRLFKAMLDTADEQSAAVFLGDNIYPEGMPDSTDPGRAEAERRMVEQLKTVQDFKGRVVVIPGNHDWHNGKKDGLERLKRQEEFVESYLDRGNTFLPDDGYPGPVDLELMDDDEHPDLREDIRLIILDTQWWLSAQQNKPFGDTGEYELNDAGDFLVELDGVLKERRNDHVLVAGHHPLFSNGNHGGHFSSKKHLWPPLGGLFYVAYRKYFGLEQDIPHPDYQSLKRELTGRFAENQDLIYASGHEHNLQYFKKGRKRLRQHYVVSGSGSKKDFVTKGRDVTFASDRKGFAVIRYYTDGSSWLEMWSPEGDGSRGKMLFRTRLGDPYADPFDNKEADIKEVNIPDYSDSTVTVQANPAYDEPGGLVRFFLGDHNRELWSVPVEVPVLDIGSIDGGLNPTEIGGTGQSTTLRLENEEGQDYVLRSVDKQAGKIWDEELRNTFAHDLAQDQFSIIHPYGAFIIPDLADAAGIYHTNPELYVVPDDPRLGEYADLMSGQLALLEERPDNDMSHAESMGRSEEVLATRQMEQEIDDDIDHRVDQRAFARARLFDMLLADWDRHPDQWRWASFEPADKKGKIYRPIPRDRDVAFMRMNGLIPTIGKLNFFYQYQDFRPAYGNLKGLTQNSLAQTRRFTSELTREDWIGIADSMQGALTDPVIEQAVAGWPENVYEEDGKRTIETLEIRRDKLEKVARRYYGLLAEVVDVTGSHKHERFIVERLNNRETKVTVEKRTREGEFRRVVYERTFHGAETNEIRLFGLSGVDRFDIKGNYSNGIKIRVIGGPGPDTFNDFSDVGGKSRVRFYDTAKGNTWNPGPGSRVVQSTDPTINDYNYMNSFSYDRIDPVLFFGSNTDDGLFVGGGAKIQKHGFRKFPWAQVHTIKANYAAETHAYNVTYGGLFAEAWGKWDATVDAAILSPNNVRNFYGLGNDTENTDDEEEFYQARFSQYRLAPGLVRNLQTGIHVAVRPTFEVTNFRQDEDRFVGQPQAGVSDNIFDDQWFAGTELELGVKSLDSDQNPRQGFSWSNTADINIGLVNTSDSYSTLTSDLSIFYSPSISPQITLATRFGVAHNIGQFPFYGANTLGSRNNLRGFRSTRFAGRTAAYNNAEMRVKLLNFYNYIFGGELGMLGFFDTGRVWTDGENSDVWHHGYGGGLWFSVYQQTILNVTLGFSEDGSYYSAGLGFFF